MKLLFAFEFHLRECTVYTEKSVLLTLFYFSLPVDLVGKVYTLTAVLNFFFGTKGDEQ